jgi:hypothetical protein
MLKHITWQHVFAVVCIGLGVLMLTQDEQLSPMVGLAQTKVIGGLLAFLGTVVALCSASILTGPPPKKEPPPPARAIPQ